MPDSLDYNALSLTGDGRAPGIGGDSYESGIQDDRAAMQEAHRRNFALGLLAAGLSTMGAQPRGWRTSVSPLEALGQGGLVGLETFGQAEQQTGQQLFKREQLRGLQQYRNAMLQDRQDQAQQRALQFKQLEEDRQEREAEAKRSHLESEQDRRDRMAQQQVEFGQRMQLSQQIHADTVANQGFMQALHAESLNSSNEYRQFMTRMDQARFQEDKQKAFDGAKNSLVKQLDGINKAISGSSTTPGQNSNQIKALLDNYNRQAKNLASRAKAGGLDYDPDEFKPLTAKDVPNHPFLGAYSSTHAELSESPATSTFTLPDTIKTTSAALDYLTKEKGMSRDDAITWLRTNAAR